MSPSDLFEHLTRKNSLFFTQQRGIVGLFGKDGRAFLQKMSTNDLTALSPQNPRQSCFVDSKGRLVDFAQIFEGKKDEFLLVSSYSHSDPLLNWLSSYQFIEDFALHNFDQKYSFCWQVTSALNPIKSPGLFAGHFFSAKFDEKNQLDFWGHLTASGHSPISADKEWWQTLRIAAGIPQNPNEICHKYMPQNVGLTDFIANSKGCYLGQEVVAKAITYQKNPKILVGAKLTHENYSLAKEGEEIASLDGQIGVISSRAPLYWPNRVNALVITETKSSTISHKNLVLAEFTKPF